MNVYKCERKGGLAVWGYGMKEGRGCAGVG